MALDKASLIRPLVMVVDFSTFDGGIEKKSMICWQYFGLYLVGLPYLISSSVVIVPLQVKKIRLHHGLHQHRVSSKVSLIATALIYQYILNNDTSSQKLYDLIIHQKAGDNQPPFSKKFIL